MVFCFVQNFFFGQHENQNIYFFCRTKREFFFQNLTLGCMIKTLNHIFFFPPPKSEYFFQQHWESEYFFRKKNITPSPWKLNGPSPTGSPRTNWTRIVSERGLVKISVIETDTATSGLRWIFHMHSEFSRPAMCNNTT